MTGIDSTRSFRRRASGQAPNIRRSERIVALSILLGVLGLVFAAIAAFAIGTLDQAGSESERREQFWVSLISLVGAVFFVSAIFVSVATLNRKWRVRRASAELAISRGWHYNLEWDARAYPATLFGVGSRAWVENSMHRHEPLYLEVGNYSYQTTERASGRREIGFVAVGLERRLPHLYLESTHRGKPRAYIPSFKTQQRLSLEGDFDRHFRLYCPSEYERDALYALTPDIMALMIDEAPGFDIEIVDDWLFVIARESFDMTDGRVLDFADRVGSTLGAGAVRQTLRYTDERSGDPAFVGESGARLRRGRWLLAVLPALLAGAVWVGIAWTTGLIPIG